MPVKPFGPIAGHAAVARSEGQGRPRCFHGDDAFVASDRTGSRRGRRSLALDGSEHGGRLMVRRKVGSCTHLFVRSVLSACMTMSLIMSPANAEPASGLQLERSASASNPPDPWSAHICEAAKRFDIPEHWIRAVMHVESSNDRLAVSPKGAIGLMQIMPATWQELRAKHRLGDDAFLPRDNILAGAAYMREMIDRFGKRGFLAAYNAGPTRYKEYLTKGRSLPAETVDYVDMLAPLIDGTALIPLTARQHGDRRNALRSPVFVQSRRSWDVDRVRGGQAMNASGTVFTTVGSPNVAASDNESVTGLAAIEPPMDGADHIAASAVRSDHGRLFVRRSSAPSP